MIYYDMETQEEYLFISENENKVYLSNKEGRLFKLDLKVFEQYFISSEYLASYANRNRNMAA